MIIKDPMKENIGESLHQLLHSYRYQIRNAALEANISIPVTHIRALKCINKMPNCSAKSISEKLSLDKSQVTRVINELQADSLIEKDQDPENYRSQLLSLTNTGREQLLQVLMLEQSAVETMTRDLTDQQVADFIHITNIMISNSLSLPQRVQQD